MATVTPKNIEIAIPKIFPTTFREKNCGFEDWARYIAASAAFVGVVWSLANDSVITGSLSVVSFVGITAQHIAEKTCGAQIKMIRAAQAHFKQLGNSLMEANKLADSLNDANKEWAAQDAKAQDELNPLVDSEQNIEGEGQKIAVDVRQLSLQNAELQQANTKLQQLLASQKEVVEQHAQILKGARDENEGLKQKLKELAGFISQFHGIEQQLDVTAPGFAEKWQALVTQLQTQLANLKTSQGNFAQIQAENARMREEILRLSQLVTKSEAAASQLAANVAALKALQDGEKQVDAGLADLIKRIEADHAAMNEIWSAQGVELAKTTEVRS